jgi:DNA-binding MarR family transcriptional regulator
MTKHKTKFDLNHCDEIGKVCTVFNLRKASRAVTQLYDEIMRPSGTLPTQFTLLVATRAMGPVTISRMAKELALDRTTLTRNLKPLEREGLIIVVCVKDDQRSREISLTSKGLKKLEQALPYWKEAQSKAVKVLGANRHSRMLNDLKAAVASTSEIL